jgi:F-type H+-transporting ATPase subunit gamma
MPFAQQIFRSVTACAEISGTTVGHPLLRPEEAPRRVAMIIVSADRGLAGGYNSAIIRTSEELAALLRQNGREIEPYLIGRKVLNYYKFRQRPFVKEWTGISETPTFADAKEIADEVLSRFEKPYEEGGIDAIHIVYTRFVSMLTQEPRVRRLLPLELEILEQSEVPEIFQALPLYEFEPDAETVLDTLLPRYVTSLIHLALLQAAASEQAARRRAMKAASDNATELTRTLTRRANQARQSEITQEISEIVGGADALAAATAGRE